MKRAAMTAAEQQIEALRQLKQGQGKRKAAPLPAAPKAVAPPLPASQQAARPVGAPLAPAFELSEGQAPRARREGPALPLSVETWKRLRHRQRETKEFKGRREMAEWAAELLLALPPQTHKLSPAARADLFQRMQEWAKARGL